ncbi:MAG: electron transport complex subunit RsxC [Candidatus Geothermincolia bacterium]
MALLEKIREAFFATGGVHPPAQRIAASMQVTEGPAPDFVVIPLEQHVGAGCRSLVAKGDRVLVGQKIGDTDAYVSAPIHSSVSGEVEAVVMYPHPRGTDALAIKIRSDGLFTPIELQPASDPLALSTEETLGRIREAGIVGMGGAAFPTHVKLAGTPGKPIETVILNGAECEPFLSADYRLMLEQPREIVMGGLIIKKTLGAERLVIGIESDRIDSATGLADAAREFGVELIALPCRYPTGAEKTLVKAALGREVPSGGLPMDVGVMVSNVGTAAQIYRSLSTGMPLVERIVTVAGDGVKAGANLRVRIGTPVSDIIAHCGGYSGTPGKLILGGPMMGIAQYAPEVPVVKGTSGIVVLQQETVFRDEPERFTCIRCGRCVKRCPMNLMPYQMAAYADHGLWDKLEEVNIMDCVECGSCSYICPAKNSLVQLMKVGKLGLKQRKQKMERLAAERERDASPTEEEENVDGR